MKKLLPLIAWLFLVSFAEAQVTTTNRQLIIPQAVPGTWGEDYNNNFRELDLSKLPRVSNAQKPGAPEVNEVVVVVDAASGTTCTTGGGATNNICQWTGSTWVSLGSAGGAGAGHIIENEGVALPAQSNLNFVGGGVDCTNTGGKTVCVITGSATATAVQTNQSNTYTTGAQDFTSATSFTFPRQTGASPTGSGQCAYDITSNTYRCGFNGVTLTLATTNLVQPLSANLTALSGLAGANGKIPYFTAAGTMALTSGLETPCPDTGGQHLNLSSIGTFVCGTSGSGSLSGGTTGTLLKYASATTATNSILTESAGVVTVGGGLVVGATPFLIMDTSAIATSDKTWTVLNQSGTIRPSTGAIAVGDNLTINANGLIVSNGLPGTGTWNDASTNTGTNKTLVDEAASTSTTGNSIVIGIAPYWDAGAFTFPSTSTCTTPVVTTINSGPSAYTTTCTDASTSAFEGSLTLRQAVATVNFTLTVNDVDSSSHVFGGDFSAMCRNNGDTVNATWGTSQSVAITMTTVNNNYTGLTATVTPNGTCGLGATLFWRFVVNPATFTDDGDARVLGVLMKQVS